MLLVGETGIVRARVKVVKIVGERGLVVVSLGLGRDRVGRIWLLRRYIGRVEMRARIRTFVGHLLRLGRWGVE